MALPKKIRGLFSDSDAHMPDATEAESGLRRIPEPVQDDVFADVPTIVYERPANDIRGLADLLEPVKPPPVPFVARFGSIAPREKSRVDPDTLTRIVLPPPTVVPEAPPKKTRPRLRRMAGFAAAAVALVAAGWVTADVALNARSSEVAQPPAVAAAPAPAATPAPAQPEPELAALEAPSAEPVLLEDVVIRVPAGRSVPRRASAPLPHHPSRAQVLAALRPLHDDVQRCAEGHYGVASARIVVSPSGRVTTATITDGSVAGTAAGSCIARTLRRAQFPEFGADRFVVQYPFQL